MAVPEVKVQIQWSHSLSGKLVEIVSLPLNPAPPVLTPNSIVPFAELFLSILHAEPASPLLGETWVTIKFVVLFVQLNQNSTENGLLETTSSLKSISIWSSNVALPDGFVNT